VPVAASGVAPVPDVGLDDQWAVVHAFIAASRAGDFERLLAVLDPEVVLRSDGGVPRPALSLLVRGAQAVTERAMAYQFVEASTRIHVNGIPGGVAWTPDGDPLAVLAVTVRGRRIVEIDVLADPDRLGRLDLAAVAR
jgi:hypothetical protein